MKCFSVFLGFLLACSVNGQTWVLEKELDLKDSTFNWTSDEWGQLYQWKGNAIWLQQNLNAKPFQETYKTLGEISSVQAINGLRALIFSENQQMVGALDNTLQLTDGLLALYDVNFSSVTHVAVSIRPDFIWLFDQYRERLVLFNINTAQIVQIVDNCFNGMQEAKLVQFFEYQQNLICQLSDGRFFEFDRNLTLIQKLTLAPDLTLFGYQNEIWLQDQNWIEKIKPSFKSSRIELPIHNYKQLQVLQDRFYFQQGAQIKVYRLKL